MKRNIVSIILVLSLALFMSACSGPSQTDNKNSNQVEEKGFPMEITDLLERKVTISKLPERIVSLSPATTEMLYELGLGSKIVGVTDYDDYPADVNNKPKIGGFNGPNLEAIAQQNPDIIFASSISGKEQMEALQEFGIPVVILEAKEINKIYDSYNLLSKITQTEEQGQKIIKEMQEKITIINEKVKDLPKVKVYYIVDLESNWTAGNNTFIHELINLAGGQNIAEDITGWTQYSLEKIVEKDPEIIVSSAHTGVIIDSSSGVDVSNIKHMVGYRETSAAKNNKVYIIEDPNIISRPSYRIVLGLEQFAQSFHPEAFKQ